jgi:uncharacterized membrane protein
VAFGILQLVFGRFVRLVPPLPPWVPWPSFWACLIGAALVLAGVAIATGRGAREALAGVGALLVLSILFLHLPKIATNPGVGAMWTNPCKALALLGGVILVAGALPGAQADRSPALARLFRRAAPLSPLFLALFLILAGIQHFVYQDFVATLVPAWIPGARYWVYLTGLALIAGGVGILVLKAAPLAATLVGIMIFLWVLLLHIPRAMTDPHPPGETAGVFEALALSGAAFILADRRPRAAATPSDVSRTARSRRA